MGANNLSWFVHTPADSYVLRIAKHTTQAGIRVEQRVLQALSRQALPFAVPVALPTKTSALSVRLSSTDTYATLTRRLSGEVTHLRSLAQLYAAGHALGQLVQALGRVPQIKDQARYPLYGALAEYLPLGYTPRSAIAAAAFDAPAKQKLTALIERVETAIPELYRILPRQLVHRDYVAPNVLMKGNNVAAVLDFELVAKDLRALDVAVALTWWTMDAASQGDWEGFELFGEGYYLGGGPLTETEARALPTLAQLRLAWGVIYALGRYLSGLDTDSWLQDFLAKRALSLEGWLTSHEDELIAHALQWVNKS